MAETTTTYRPHTRPLDDHFSVGGVFLSGKPTRAKKPTENSIKRLLGGQVDSAK